MKRNFYSIFLVIAFLSILSSCNKDDANDTEQQVNCEELTFRSLDFQAAAPNCLNVLFQVIDEEGQGIPDLTESDFQVLENEQEVGSEAGVTIVPNDQIPFELKTVLLLDVSTSVENEIDDIKEAAISLVNNKADNQKIAIYTFSSETTQELDFSDNVDDLIDAINNITVGSSSTNLYGALITASNLYVDSYSIQQIVAGNIVLFTDGDDTQGTSSLEQAQTALITKDLYVVALDGPDFDDDARNALNSLLPIRLLESSNASELDDLFNEILDNIIRLSRSTYRLFFSSPKRGNNQHQLGIKFNCEDNFNRIDHIFNSSDFEDGDCSATTSVDLTYSCVSGNCQTDENGSFTSLAECQAACGDTSGGFNCVSGNCITSANGTYATLAACQNQCANNDACGATFTDPRDGEVYNLVTIGSQCWFAENVRYSAGIQQITGNQSWVDYNTNQLPAWTYYNDNSSLNIPYGKLYNGYAVSSEVVCPTGWRVPNDTDWQILSSFLGGDAVAGGALKSTTLWNAPNTGATNSSGFTGLPGGYRSAGNGNSAYINASGIYWSSTSTANGTFNYKRLNNTDATLYSGNVSSNFGFSCRCIKE